MIENYRRLARMPIMVNSIFVRPRCYDDGRVMSNLLVIPVVHGRLEPAKRVRRALAEFAPDAIAVEIPETLTAPFLRAVDRLPLLSLLRWREGSGRYAYFIVEPIDGMVEAARWGREHGCEVVCADADTEGYEGHIDLVPDTWALERMPPERYDELCRAGTEPRSDPEDARREAIMAFHVRRLLDAGRRVALVCGAFHAARVEALLPEAVVRPLGRTKREVELFHLHEDASREVLSEPPFIQAGYEHWRSAAPGVELACERYQLIMQLMHEARARYLAEDEQELSTTAMAVLLRMARNWSYLGGRLAPDLMQLVTCAAGVGGDDFAYRFWEVAVKYPWQSAAPGLPVLRPTVEDLYEHAAHLRFRRTLPTRRHRLRLVPPRPRERHPGDWKNIWQGKDLVSYPPEDLVIEGYGLFLRRRAVGILATEQSRTEPLTTSLCDGIDLRETIRNLAHDGRIFVRENRPVKGEVGAVVVIFDEDKNDQRFSWKMTWQGEHDQESDMSLYSTAPGNKLVGPGISRCEYGGFLMSMPPGRMFQVWQDPFFNEARSKAERLLLAGIDYSLERMIVYIAANPPRSALSARARRHGKKVVFVPLAQLSPIMLRKIRSFHILDGRRVRSYARQFIR